MKDTPYPTFISELRAIFHEFYKDIYKILQNNCTSYVVLIWYADLEKSMWLDRLKSVNINRNFNFEIEMPSLQSFI